MANGSYSAASSGGISVNAFSGSIWNGISSSGDASNSKITITIAASTLTTTARAGYAAASSGGLAVVSYCLKSATSSVNGNMISTFFDSTSAGTAVTSDVSAVASAGIALWSTALISDISYLFNNLVISIRQCRVASSTGGSSTAIAAGGMAVAGSSKGGQGSGKCRTISNALEISVAGSKLAVTTIGAYIAAASGGVAQGAFGVPTSSIATDSNCESNQFNISLVESNSATASSSGYTAVASAAVVVSSYSVGYPGTSSSVYAGNVLAVSLSTCDLISTTIGVAGAASCAGVVLFTSSLGSISSVTDTNNTFNLVARSSNMSTGASGDSTAISSGGTASYSESSMGSSCSGTGNQLILWLTGCSVSATSTGRYSSVASVGVALTSFSSAASSINIYTNNTFSVSLLSSSATALSNGSYVALTSVGIAAGSFTSGYFNNIVANGDTSLNKITISATRTTLGATVLAGPGYSAASSGGVAVCNYGSNSGGSIARSSGNRNVIKTVLDFCSVFAMTNGDSNSVTGGGIALWSSGYNSDSSAQQNTIDVSLRNSDLTVLDSGSYAAVSASGMAVSGYSRGSGSAHSCTCNAVNNSILLSAVKGRLNATASGSFIAVASIGVGVLSYVVNSPGTSSTGNTGNFVLISLSGSILEVAMGGTVGAVSSGGIALASSSVSMTTSVTDTGNTFRLSARVSNISAGASGAHAAISSGGVALNGNSNWDSAITSTSNNVVLSSSGSTLVATANGDQSAVSSAGVTSANVGTSAGCNSVCSNNSFSFQLALSSATATATGSYSAAACGGIALHGYTSSTFSGIAVTTETNDNRVNVSAIDSSLQSVSRSSYGAASSAGIALLSTGGTTNVRTLARNSITVTACNATSLAEASSGTASAVTAVGSSPPAADALLSLSSLNATSIGSTTSSCLSFRPTTNSSMAEVNASCAMAGWAPAIVPSGTDVYLQNVRLNGVIITPNSTLAQSLLSGLNTVAAFAASNQSATAYAAVLDFCLSQVLDVNRPRSLTRTNSGTLSLSYLDTTTLPLSTSLSPPQSASFSRGLQSTSLSASRTIAVRSVTEKTTSHRPVYHPPAANGNSTGRSSRTLVDNRPPHLLLEFSVTSSYSRKRLPEGKTTARSSALNRVLGKEASLAVVSTTALASVLGTGLISPALATRVPMMRALANSIRCAWVEQDLDDRPSYLDLPLQFLPIGDHPKLRFYAGGVVLCGTFILLWELMSLLCYKFLVGRLHRHIESFLGIASILWIGYLLPNIAQASVIVLWHATGTAEVGSTALIFGTTLGSSLIKWLWALLPSQFVRNAPPFRANRSEDGRTVKIVFATDSVSVSVVSWLRYFGPLIDGTVDPGRSICRVVVVEEITVGILLGVLAGIKPESSDSCRYTSGAMCGITGSICSVSVPIVPDSMPPLPISTPFSCSDKPFAPLSLPSNKWKTDRC